jgi:hypothetical protein
MVVASCKACPDDDLVVEEFDVLSLVARVNFRQKQLFQDVILNARQT